MPTIKEIFSLTDVEALKALQIYVRHFVHGLITGMHQSTKTGFGIEFKEYKNYTPGDSLKQLDWKYFAKTDHYMIKEAEVERQHDFIFVLDKSESMLFEDDKLSKFDLAKAFIASVSYLVQQQHDKYQLFNVGSQAKDFETYLYELIKLKTETKFQYQQMMPAQKQSAKSTVFIITDAYLEDEELVKLLKNWAHASDRVVFIHMLLEKELTLNFDKKNYRFKDLESGEMLQVNTREALSDYQEQLANWQQHIRKLCAKNGILYFQLKAEQTLQNDIIKLLDQMNFNLR